MSSTTGSLKGSPVHTSILLGTLPTFLVSRRITGSSPSYPRNQNWTALSAYLGSERASGVLLTPSVPQGSSGSPRLEHASTLCRQAPTYASTSHLRLRSITLKSFPKDTHRLEPSVSAGTGEGSQTPYTPWSSSRPIMAHNNAIVWHRRDSPLDKPSGQG